MKRPRTLVLLATLALAPTAFASVDASAAAPSLTDKVLGCYVAEGGSLTDDDRAVVASSSDDLVALFGPLVGGAACEGAAAGSAACVAALAALDCTTLGAPLVVALADAGAPDLPKSGAAEAWAIAFAGVLTDRVVACAQQEQGAAPSADDLARVSAYRDSLAQSMSLFTQTQICTVDASQQQPCFAAIAGMPCGGVATGLAADAPAMIESLASACSAYLRCQFGPDLDAGL